MLKIAQFLFKNFFALYKPLYWVFKNNSDKENILFFKKYIKENHIVFDIGANIGFTANIFSKLVGKDGHIIAFEPDITNFMHLQQEVQKSYLKNIVAINKAISDKSGVLKLYRSPHLNVDHRAYKVDEFSSMVEIECISIDDYVNETKISPNFIKIDIQGYEYQAFLGLKNTINSSNKLIIFTEFWPYALNRAGYSSEKLISLWKEYGFIVYKIDDKKLRIIDEEEITSYYSWPKNKFCNFILSKNKLI